jgi:transcription initiation factor TFIIE subunit alpha
MDNEAARRAKITESNKKRQQNALPVWHQQSTISTPLTGTGDREIGKEESESDEEDQFEAVENDEYDQDRADCKT